MYNNTSCTVPYKVFISITKIRPVFTLYKSKAMVGNEYPLEEPTALNF